MSLNIVFYNRTFCQKLIKYRIKLEKVCEIFIIFQHTQQLIEFLSFAANSRSSCRRQKKLAFEKTLSATKMTNSTVKATGFGLPGLSKQNNSIIQL